MQLQIAQRADQELLRPWLCLSPNACGRHVLKGKIKAILLHAGCTSQSVCHKSIWLSGLIADAWNVYSSKAICSQVQRQPFDRFVAATQVQSLANALQPKGNLAQLVPVTEVLAASVVARLSGSAGACESI